MAVTQQTGEAGEKGLREGTLGFLSGVVIGVASVICVILTGWPLIAAICSYLFLCWDGDSLRYDPVYRKPTGKAPHF